MALFESKQTKAAKRQVAIRMARKKVERYIAGCRNMADEYLRMAGGALRVNDEGGCDQYLYNRLRYRQQADKWGAFLLRMKDLSMRGEMATAINGLVEGMGALTKEIRATASPKAMGKIVADLNLASEQLGQTEDMLTGFMEQLDLDIGSPMETGQPAGIPEDMRAEVDRMREQLLDGVVVQERSGERGLAGGAVDERLNAARDKLARLRK